jgi:hypothetical protein
VLAEDESLHRSGLADHARTIDGGRDVADAAHDAGIAEGRAQGLVLQHAVLERDDRRLRPDQRLDLGERSLGVP